MVEGEQMKTFYVINDHRKTRFLFWMCWMVYFTSYLGRLNYSSAMTVMIQEAVITKAEAGFISMVYFFAYGIGQLCNGLLGDRLHPGRMITGGLLISAVINMVMTYTHGFVSMSLFWCINGYAQSMIWPPIIRIFSEMLEEKKKVQYCIDIVSTQALGTLASYLLSAAIIGCGHWEFVFLAAGVLLFTAAMVWTVSFQRIESYSRRCGIRKKEEREKNEADLSGMTLKGTTSSGADHGSGHSFVKLIVTSGMVMIIFPVIIHGMLKDGVTSWVPTYISETFRISASFSILVTTLLPVVNLSGAYMARYVYEKLEKQETKAAVFFYVAATAALILLLAAGNRNLILTAVLFAVITASMMAVNTLFVNLYPLKFKAQGRVSAVSGFLNAMAYLGTAFSTFSIGILVQNEGWSVTLVSWIGVTFLAMAVCQIAAVRERKKEGRVR